MKEDRIILTSAEKKGLSVLINILERNLKQFVQELQKTLLQNPFKNTYLLNPDDFREYISKEMESFIGFMKTRNFHWAEFKGSQAAVTGLDKNIISFLCKALRNLFREHLTKENLDILFLALELIGRYKDAYQDSFIQAFTDQKNDEQEGLFDALTEILLKQREELAEKESQLQQQEIDKLKTIKVMGEIQIQQRTNYLVSFAHDVKHLLSRMQTRLLSVKREAVNRKLPSLPYLEEDHNKFIAMFSEILDTEKILKNKKIYEHKKLINVSNLVAEKIELFKDIAGENNVRITREIEPGLFIRMSPQALDRVLDNIISNAIKFNKQDGNIHITVKGDDKSVVLIITDTGIGIKEDQKEHLFKPYFQMTLEKRNHYEGFGAGLFIAKGIVKEVAGEINIRSKENRGTTVTITFKRETRTKKDEIEEQIILTKPLKQMKFSLKPEKWEQGKKTILFVEDDMELLAIMQNELDGEFNYYYAPNGCDALRKLDTMEKPDIIVSDIVMDPGDGYKFLRELRKIHDMEDVPFIFLTAKTAPLEIIEGLRRGAIDYIEKPFNVEIFKEKVKTLLHNREIHTEKEICRMERKISKTIRTPDHSDLKFNQLAYKYNLTRQEKRVMKYLLKGLNRKQIMEKLFISLDTVNTHFKNIKRKCNVDTLVRLVLLFLT